MRGIYFWKYKELALALHHNAVSKKQFRVYLLLFLILWIAPRLFLSSYAISAARKFCAGNLSGYDPAYVIYALGFLPLFLLSTYIVNRRGDRKDYFKRLICSYLPISIRAMVILFPVGFVLGIMAGAHLHTPGMSREEYMEKVRESGMEYLIQVLFDVYFFILYVKSFLIASGQKIPTIPNQSAFDLVHDRPRESGDLDLFT